MWSPEDIGFSKVPVSSHYTGTYPGDQIGGSVGTPFLLEAEKIYLKNVNHMEKSSDIKAIQLHRY